MGTEGPRTTPSTSCMVSSHRNTKMAHHAPHVARWGRDQKPQERLTSPPSGPARSGSPAPERGRGPLHHARVRVTFPVP